jgi:hypothetical protein
MNNSHVIPNAAVATVVNFPKRPEASKAANVKRSSTAAAWKARKGGIGNVAVKVVWICTVVVWPFLKWVISIDCVFKLIRMLYYWHTPGVHAGATFLLHYSVLILLTYFVRFYKPKGL